MGNVERNVVQGEGDSNNMIKDIEKKFTWFLILLPGFISLGLARYISDMGNMSEFELIIYSSGFTVVNLGLSIVLYNGGKALGQRWLPRRGDPDTQSESPLSKMAFILLVLVVSFGVGIAAGVAYENDTLLNWLRAAPGTRLLSKRSYQRPLTFLLAQNRKGKLEEGRPHSMKTTQAWVEVHLTGGESFEGWPEFFSSPESFSTGDENAEIFLSPACKRVKKDGRVKVVIMPGPGVLVFEKDIKFVEFIDRQKSECHNLWKRLASS